jgi:hypothetical protein
VFDPVAVAIAAAAGEDDGGEQKYLAGFNIANVEDFGFYKRPRGDDC